MFFIGLDCCNISIITKIDGTWRNILHSVSFSLNCHLNLFIVLKRNCRSFSMTSDHLPSNVYSPPRCFAFHQHQLFFQHPPSSIPTHPPSEETDDCDDDTNSIHSIETRPSTTTRASLVKHSIENILSNKFTTKHKRPFSSSSICTFH